MADNNIISFEKYLSQRQQREASELLRQLDLAILEPLLDESCSMNDQARRIREQWQREGFDPFEE